MHIQLYVFFLTTFDTPIKIGSIQLNPNKNLCKYRVSKNPVEFDS